MKLRKQRTSDINYVFISSECQWPHGKWSFYCSLINEKL